MEVQDYLYLGPPSLLVPGGSLTPTLQSGVGPLGQINFYDIVPLTKGANTIALSQHTTASTALTLTAGTGVTAGTAPDGSGSTVYLLDVPRSVSIASAANLSGMTFLVSGFDVYGRAQTNRITGPNNSTVNTTKAFKSVLSVVPSATDGVNNVTVGTADKFGLPWLISDAGYLVSVGWDNTLARDAGTFVAGDATDPATATTTDPRGTYVPSGAANGSKRLVIGMALKASQCGPSATLAGAIGVTPA